LIEEERRRLRHRLELQELIHAFSSKMRSQRDLASIARVLTDAVSELTSFRNAFLTVLDEDGRSLRGIGPGGGHRRTYEIGSRLSKYHITSINIDINTHPTYSRALETGEMVYHSTKEDIVSTLHLLTGINPGILEIIRRTTRMNSALTVPLFLGDSTVGRTPLGILAVSSIKSKFDEEDVNVVRILADQASLALHNASLIKRLKAQAIIAKVSETRFRKIIDSAHDMIISYSTNGDVKFANNAFCDSKIYSTKGELVDSPTLDKVHPDDQPKLVEAYLAIKEKRPIFGMEYRIQDSSGEYVTHNLNASVVKAEGEEAGEIVTFIRDVTIERERERQIAKRNQELEILNALITNLTSDLEPDEMINRSLAIIAEFTGADMITLISTTDLEDGRLTIKAHLWLNKDDADFLNANFPRVQETDLFKGSRVFSLSDFSVLPTMFQKWLVRMGVKTLIFVPVTLRGNEVGFVVAAGKEDITLDDEAIAILHAIGDQLGLTIEVAKIIDDGSPRQDSTKEA
jgi:PAS domain S-box-containing protein